MYGKMKDWLQGELASIREQGLYKSERIIMGPQGADIRVKTGQEVINLCANNYLGLSSHPQVVAACHEGLDRWGFGMSSVRFICGTQDIHKTLEEKVSAFLGTEDTILYSSCFDANGGVFEPLLDKDCAIITDQLNHASIIDGIRLCKAQRLIYQHADMADLEAKLRQTQSAKYRLISTDGAFSMDGDVAKLAEVCDLAEKYDALVQVDDAHATGFLGKTGRGSHEHNGVMGRVDIITGTFGKALGGASGGFTSGRREIIELLRQRSRPYLFSNTVSSAVVYATIAVFDLLTESTELRDRLEENTRFWRAGLTAAGFDIKPGVHPIVPIMLYDAVLAQRFAARLLEEGIYAVGFFYPVVPKGQARIRTQMSAAHQRPHLEKALGAFTRVGKELGVLK